MTTLITARTAQYVLEAEFVFNFGDNMLDINGVSHNFSDVQTSSIFELIPLPPNSTVVGGELSVDVALVGPTAATLSLGDSSSATRYASAVSLLSAGRTALTLTGFITDLNIRGTLSETVAVATAGKVTVRVLYTVLNRSQEVSIK
jgi:hypothetical protein